MFRLNTHPHSVAQPTRLFISIFLFCCQDLSNTKASSRPDCLNSFAFIKYNILPLLGHRSFVNLFLCVHQLLPTSGKNVVLVEPLQIYLQRKRVTWITGIKQQHYTSLIKVSADMKAGFCSLADRKCNPSLLGIIGLNSTGAAEQGDVVQWWDAQGIVGLVLFLLCVLYSRYIRVFLRLLAWSGRPFPTTDSRVNRLTYFPFLLIFCTSAFVIHLTLRWTSWRWQVTSQLWLRTGLQWTALRRTVV